MTSVLSNELLPDELKVWSNVTSEEPSKAVPGRRHSNGHGKGSEGERKRCGPERRPMDAMERDEIIGDQEQDQDAEAGDSPRSLWEPDLIPWKTAERGFR